MPRTVSIVGSSGPGAFAPNPIEAAAGDPIVWVNSDRTLHEIVLGDGTSTGNILPGQSSAPITLTTGATTYRCTIHPSMVGTIGAAPAPAPPTDDYYPPPRDPYDDGGYY